MYGFTQGMSNTSFFQIKQNNIFIPSAELYLDARKKKSTGFISHAHSDHSARHEQIISSRITADLLQLRYKNINCTSLNFKQPFNLKDAKITLYPAGHILGSSQILIESRMGKLLYTGDFRTAPSRTAEKFIPVNCDVLIMECTFGSQEYCFPPRESVEDVLLQLVREKLLLGITPVIFAYPLGKAQEVLHLLSTNNFPVTTDYAIIRLARVYQKYGIHFGAFEKFKRSDYRDKIVLLPANYRFRRFVQNIQPRYTVFLSGWGMDPSARFRYKVDRVLPYSDHADYNELLQFALNSGAREIFCTHGFESFVTVLKNHGLNANLLIPPDQLEIF
jgi:Cft2 family RNA processing exonuclease